MPAFALLNPRYLTNKNAAEDFPTASLAGHDVDHFGILCYRDHKLVKVIVTGDDLNECYQIADVVRTLHGGIPSDEFWGELEQDFPGEVYVTQWQDMEKMFA